MKCTFKTSNNSYLRRLWIAILRVRFAAAAATGLPILQHGHPPVIACDVARQEDVAYRFAHSVLDVPRGLAGLIHDVAFHLCRVDAAREQHPGGRGRALLMFLLLRALLVLLS